MKKSLFILTSALLLITSCSKDDPEVPNEEEVITTLHYVLTPNLGGMPVSMTFQDLDGDGGNAPIITGGELAANTTYNGTLTILNETATPVEDITEEIEEEDEEHQFFFTSTLATLSVSYDDVDADNNPVGLATIVQTGGIGTGELTITLRHEPNKNAAGVISGDITNAGGETDIEVTFPISVQ
ncbi:hypothetical protein N9G63_04185 [Chitinophagales bacterium]|nr:hypothetical protein [Chitinophagales bacterium]